METPPRRPAWIAALLGLAAAGVGCSDWTLCEGLCPAEMVQIGTRCSCIDRYEASGAPGEALSRPGAIPHTRITWVEAKAACAAAGKRLCRLDEWEAACLGDQECDTSTGGCGGIGYSYHDGETCFPYGVQWQDGACNGPETSLQPTGASVRCEGGLEGLHDMAGNVEEWLDECDGTGTGCSTVGGSFESMSLRDLSCVNSDDRQYSGVLHPFEYDFQGDEIGFRCCLTLPER